MGDYGHDLLFGTFLTPANANPQQAVLLTRLCEELGLDLATFQDHPYQPSFLDTWTLMSYAAAQTTTIRISANVTNLPLRPPAVLARAVASLDLLSGGRVELGIGAGGFWDAIEAMGGRRLAPGDAVRALEEAIEVVREVWDAEARGGVRVDGEFYRVAGAKRGPAPAHDVSVWVGAYKPRMLNLVGRVADGWLPTYGYLKPGDLARGNELIDAAAEEAGRAPASVRRLLNVGGQFSDMAGGDLDGPPGQWVDQLTRLALEDGVSAFILATDDPEAIETYATQVVPAVRELVQSERVGRDSPPSDEGVPVVEPVVETVTGGAPRAGFAVVPTPDTGERLSVERLWDESARPTGPDPDPERSYTAHEQATAQHLIEVHNHLRGELAQIRDLIEQVAAGELDLGAARSHINEMTMRQNKWTLGTYCESYCRVVTTHHSMEDQGVFPHLRRGDPRLAPVIDRLQVEHVAIHDVLERVDRALVALVSNPDGIPELRAAVDLLSDTLLSHLSYEERELVEPLARIGFY